VILPIVPPQSPRLPSPDLKPSPNPLPEPETVAKPEYTVSFDLVNETTTLTIVHPTEHTTYTVSSKNPGQAVMKATRELIVSKPDSEIKVQAQCVTSSDAKVFRHLVEVEVLVNGKRHFEKSWSVVVPRDLN
jgi:hypothetical protein